LLGKRFWYITDPTLLVPIALECYRSPAIAVDVETTRRRDLPEDLVFNENIFPPGLDPFMSEIRLLQIATLENIYVIDLWYCPDVEVFRDIFMHPGILKIGHNLKFDIKMLMRQFGFDFRHIFDTMLASQLLTNGLPEFFMRHNLHEVARRELGIDLDKAMQVSDWGRQELTEEQIMYAAKDVDVLHDICRSLANKMVPKDFIVDTVTGRTLDLLPVMKLENGLGVGASAGWQQVKINRRRSSGISSVSYSGSANV
jgi:ribonuclease D